MTTEIELDAAWRAAHAEREKAIEHLFKVLNEEDVEPMPNDGTAIAVIYTGRSADAEFALNGAIERLATAHLAYTAVRRKVEAPITGRLPTFPKPKLLQEPQAT
jgi:hypothetical protein